MSEILLDSIETEWVFDILFLPIIAIISVFTGN